MKPTEKWMNEALALEAAASTFDTFAEAYSLGRDTAEAQASKTRSDLAAKIAAQFPSGGAKWAVVRFAGTNYLIKDRTITKLDTLEVD